jgi:hypothetical protein
VRRAPFCLQISAASRKEGLPVIRIFAVRTAAAAALAIHGRKPIRAGRSA